MPSLFRRIGLAVGCLKPPTKENRVIFVDNKPPLQHETYIPQKYCDNQIITSKYTLWNFLPKNLFEQFHRIANFYFLCVGVIELLIESPVSPATSILPLIFVITTTGIKQGYEDWLRHKSDKEVNNRPAWVLRGDRFVEIRAMDIQVGDIVKVHINHSFPCDLVQLSSHDPSGDCTVTTANLDGETNLKTFISVPATKNMQTEDDLSTVKATIECQQPIADLYKFIGRITVEVPNQQSEKVCQPLGAEHVLLRGSRLKNTPFVHGCAIYTGQDTKMAINSKFKIQKYSKVERAMNTFLICFMILLLLETSLCLGLRYYTEAQPTLQNSWFIRLDNHLTARQAIEDFLIFAVLFNYIIPISLYVTIEVQKFIGSMFFAWDIKMYDDGTEQAAKANTSDLNEELGQVEYLFTDKTGTLTENDMQFRQCSVNGTKYIEVGGLVCEKPDIPGVQPQPVSTLTSDMEWFFTVLALCHTVRIEKAADHQINGIVDFDTSDYDFEYQASSPDEKAFVDACRRYGVVYQGVKDEHQEVKVKGKVHRYKQLHVLEFDATRKRMSTVVQDEQGNIYLLCKGAESAILCNATSGNVTKALQHVNDYAMLGLRTLVISQRKLSEEEYEKFDHELTSARKALENREEKLAEVFNTLESNLKILGATAVEDRLQDGVPETIEALRMAGINVWVLTGDKEETAVNISYSAGHFKPGAQLLRLTQLREWEECSHLIQQHRQAIESSSKDEETFALVIDGASLSLVIRTETNQDQEHKQRGDELHSLCHMCQAVLCCRMSPIQKAQIVQLIKHGKDNPVTAAIGDGANDVSMIQEAHVGLGVMGKEGRQAVRCSDYAFARFRFLMRALFVHGHLYYVRIATLVQYFFYKNVAFITAQVYFAFFSGFSAQSIYDSFFLTFFNITFTSLPILIYGLFEQHIPPDKLMEMPKLYKKIRKNAMLSPGQFIKWNLLGIWHSVVLFFGCIFIFKDGLPLSGDGVM
ncbi:probable phospholipid-transporting ATPase IF [Lingula anatina]|uniref:Phospholipid-transporting ATPase n=1 Tax=Lingula anatina TaxID=7574 RepID=A0A1S3K0W2_LINAN|nr:probable phospholipid-transporting ATPase IF [Lingula anatina]|eukprot:XP_013415921.1 probable phospholipid-transporting ATPase IF [Lingula anatina]